MSNSWSNGWQLARQSVRLLGQEKSLLIFPLLSTAACIAVLASFLVPVLIVAGVFDGDLSALERFGETPGIDLLVMFAFYFVNFFIITFFNAALSACVIDHLRGGRPTVRSGFAVASSRLPQIVGWAALAATVGVILRSIAERSGLLGRIVIGLLGAAWSVTTFFVTPVLVAEQLGPVEATRRSLQLMKDNWGTTVVSNASISFAVFVAVLLAQVPAWLGITYVLQTDRHGAGSILAVATGVSFTLIALLLIGLVSSTIRSIQTAVLYEFAAHGRAPEGFDPQLLAGAFRQK